METKEAYIHDTKHKVKSLFSVLNESESTVLREIKQTGKRLEDKLDDLNGNYRSIQKSLAALENKFNEQHKTGNERWEKINKDFELLLDYMEGDKESFLQKADDLIAELADKIQEFEQRSINAAQDVKEELSVKIDDMKLTKTELQDRINQVKDDSTERWRDIKHWFMEKSHTLKSFLSH